MNKKINIFSILILSIIFHVTSDCQKLLNQVVNKEELDKANFSNFTPVNTTDLEFSPQYYGAYLIFVSSASKDKSKRFDTKINESFFRLKYVNLTENSSSPMSFNFLDNVEIPFHQGPVSFTNDLKTMFLSRNNKNPVKSTNENVDISPMGVFIYERSGNSWLLKGELPVNSYSYKTFHPTWDENSHRLIFASDMPGGFGGTDLYSITKTDTGWTDLRNLGPKINTSADEAFPFIFQSGYLFFASDKTGGFGGFDQYLSLSVNGEFEIPVNLGEKLNTTSDDFGLVVKSDGKEGFFTSNKPGGIGKDDIYHFIAQNSIFRLTNNVISFKVKDKLTNNPLENVKLVFSKFDIVKNEDPKLSKIGPSEKAILYKVDNGSIKESNPVFTNQEGVYNVKIPEGSFIVEASKPGYQTFSKVFYSSGIDQETEISLEPDATDTFRLNFVDANDRTNINNVNFEIVEGNAENIVKSSNGKFNIAIKRPGAVTILSSANNYFSKKITINSESSPRNFDVVLERKTNYVDNLPTNVGESFILKNIHYEYNSFELRPGDKKELDKLVNHMKNNPSIRIELSSYTDSRGDQVYNQLLSEKRSLAAKNYLVIHGIVSDRINTVGYGENMLLNNCSDNKLCSEKEHAINRRTEVKVIN